MIKPHVFLLLGGFSVFVLGQDVPSPDTELPPLLAADDVALRALFFGLNGPEWFNPWNTSADANLCNEGDVFCDTNDDGDSVVIEIRIGDEGLYGDFPMDEMTPGLQSMYHFRINDNPTANFTVPEGFGLFVNLEVFDLFGNGFTGPLPTDVFSLPKLRYFSVGSNFFTGELPAEVGNAKNITFFDVSFNELSGPLPDAMADMTSLQSVLLNHNSFNGSIPEHFNRDPALETLFLTRNLFECPRSNYRPWASLTDIYIPQGGRENCPTEAPSPSTNTVTTDGPSTGTIAAIVAVVVGFMAACMVMSCLWYSKRKLEAAARQRRAPNDASLNVEFAPFEE